MSRKPADKPARVLIYAMNYAPELIGCGRYTGEIGAWFHENGHPVEVVTTPPHYPGWAARDGYSAKGYTVEKSPGLRITRCPLGLMKNMKGFGRVWAPISFALTSAPAVFWRILRFRPTSVLFIEPTLFAAPAALIAAKIVGAKTVLHVQDLEIDAAFAVGHLKNGLLKGFVSLFEKLTLGAFDHIVTISGKMRDKLLEKGVNPQRLSIIRNWVDVEKIYPLAGENPFRAELGLDETQFIALYAGNIGVKQALSIVMDAAQTLTDRTDLTFVIAGDGPEKAALVARNLPNVKFLPLQPEDKLNTLLNLPDVHLLPQDKGAADLVLPSKIGGMLASGKKIIALADEGTEIYDFLKPEATLTPTGDAAALAQGLRDMLDQPKGPGRDPSQSEAIRALNKDQAMQAFKACLSAR